MGDSQALQAGGAVVAAFKSPSGKRAEPRVMLPLSVEVAGQTLPAQDWSLGGLSLSQPLPALTRGDVVTLNLRFGAGDAQITLNGIEAQVVRAAPEVAPAFEFLTLKPGHRRLLDRIVTEYLSGQLISFEELLASAPRYNTAVRRAPRSARVLLACVGLLLALAALGFIGYRAVFTAQSSYAAVSVPFVNVSAPIAGTVVLEAPPPNQIYDVGAPLFKIRPLVGQSDADRLQIERTGLLARRTLLKRQLQESGQMVSALRSVYRTQRVAADRRNQSLEAELELKSAMLSRMAALAEQGDISKLELQKQQSDVSMLQRQLADASSERNNLDTQIRLSSAGLLSNSLNDLTQTPGRLREELLGIEQNLAAIDASLASLQVRQTFTSPCYCVLQSTQLQDGAMVQPSQTVLQLRKVGERTMVRALVGTQAARRLKNGSTADIELSDGRTIEGAKVERVSYRATPEDWAALPIGRETLLGMAAVEITLPMLLPDSADGMLADVRFHMPFSLHWR